MNQIGSRESIGGAIAPKDSLKHKSSENEIESGMFLVMFPFSVVVLSSNCFCKSQDPISNGQKSHMHRYGAPKND